MIRVRDLPMIVVAGGRARPLDHGSLAGRKQRSSPVPYFFASFGSAFSLASLLGAAGAGWGTQWGWWQFTEGFHILERAAYTGLAAAAVSFATALTIIMRGYGRLGLVLCLIGIVAGLAVAVLPWTWEQKAKELPGIHDITTDLENPPSFYHILPLRMRAPNSSHYGGPKVAALQRSAYPDIKPLVVTGPVAATFEKALAAARHMKWMIIDANSAEGRIEATATTFWFGFKDDIVIRIKRVRGGSRLDVRSVSRLGKGDAGTNAKRIRDYLKKISVEQ